jgi:hypothetical protein
MIQSHIEDRYIMVKSKAGWIVQDAKTFQVKFLDKSQGKALEVMQKLNGSQKSVNNEVSWNRYR